MKRDGCEVPDDRQNMAKWNRMAHLKTEVRHSAVTKSELIIKNISTNAASARQCCINGLSFKNDLAFYSYFLVLLCSTDLYCLFSYSRPDVKLYSVRDNHSFHHHNPRASMSLRTYSASSPAKLQLLSTYIHEPTSI